LSSIEELAVLDGQKGCSNCGGSIPAESRFCKYCGSIQNTVDVLLSENKWANTKQVAFFFVFDAVICCVANFIDDFKTFAWSVTFTALLAIVAVTFFCDNWSVNKTLLVWRNFSLPKLLGYCSLAALASIIVHFFATWLNRSLFSEEFYYYPFYSKYSYGKELLILFVAVMPAVFEEIGYRGFLLQKLLSIVDKKQAIFISAFLFAIIHISFISLVWLIPFALALAYIRLKEDTLWYGICIHFTFNFTACIIELMAFNHSL